MDTFTVQAVYRKGVLQPRTKLDLPEDSVVEVQVKTAKARSGLGTLLGVWSHLADSEVEDLENRLVQIHRLYGFHQIFVQPGQLSGGTL